MLNSQLKSNYLLIYFLLLLNFFAFGQQEAPILPKQKIYISPDSAKEPSFVPKNQKKEVALSALKPQKNVRSIIIETIDKANYYYSKRKIDSALIILLDKLNLAEKTIGINDTLTALINHKIGVGYSRKADYISAINFYKISLTIRKKLLSLNHPDIIRGNNNIGICFQELGELDSALYYLNLSLKLQSNPPTNFITETYTTLGRIYHDLGDFQKAEDFYLAKIIVSKSLNREKWEIANQELELSHFYVNLGSFEKVILHGKKAIQIYDSIEDKIKEDYVRMANSYINIGIANRKLNHLSRSLDNFNKALLIGKSFYSDRDLAAAYTSLGITLKNKKDFTQAYSFFFKVLNIHLKLNSDIDIAKTYHNLGDTYFDQKKYQKALTFHHQSLSHFFPNFQEKNEYKNPILKDHYIPDKKALLIFLEAKAKTFKQLYDQNQQQKDLQAAHETYQLLDELINDIRLSYLEDASKSYLVKQTKPIYEKAIGICLQYEQLTNNKKYLEQAFNYAEKSKAIILLEQIKETKAINFAKIPDSLQQQERKLKREIGQIEKQLALKGEDKNRNKLGKSLREQLIQVKGEYEGLVKTLETNNSAYHHLKYDLKNVDIPTIQKNILRDNQILVEYFVGEDFLYFFKIGKEEFEVYTKAMDVPLKEWVDSLRQGIYYCRVNKNVVQKDCQALDRQYDKYAAKLYQELIAPLNLREKTEQLIIIPDGVLGYIPFDALLIENIKPNQQNQFQQYPYLGLEYTISYSFSATFLNESKKVGSRIGNNKLLSFAPSFSIDEKQADILKVSSSLETSNPIAALRNNLSPLFFNQSEIDRIGEVFSGKSYKNKTANKNIFLQEAANYRYIHIASHGKMNDNNADLSYIAFTQDSSPMNREELLYLRELYDMEIPADMVVLSACETGIGELQNGEGIISLARGFSYAGAKSIITSLWNVNDQKTADLMVDFYQNLKEGQTKDRALANAKRNYIQSNSPNFAHPFYWAAFIPIGNMGVIEAQRDWTFAGGVLLLLILFGLIGRYWQSKSVKRKLSPKAI